MKDDQSINTIAWKACERFCGAAHPAVYKDYILVVLFIKYLSDVRQDNLEQFRQEFEGDEERVQRRMSRVRFILPAGCDFGAISDNRNDADLGKLINKALEKIEEANKVKLADVFRNVDFNSEENLGEISERNARLLGLIEDFGRLDLRPSRYGEGDVAGEAFHYLLERLAGEAGRKGGDFFTPPRVATLLARLLEPKKGDRICDPACGAGSLLIRLADEMQDLDYSLYGQESDARTWALARMNMYIHEKDGARIEWGDSLRNPRLTDGELTEVERLMKFDIVVSDTPFSFDKWGAEQAAADKFNRFHRGVPPRSKADYAFITHMIETAVEGTGKVGVIVPHGVLFRGAAEGQIRKKLIEENLLEAVIGLPADLFYGTTIPTALLLFNRGKKTTDVLFIDASREYEGAKSQSRLRERDIEKIVKAYKQFETVEKYSYRATLEEVRGNDFNLNIPRYVNTFAEEERKDVGTLEKEIDKLETELADVQKEIKVYIQELSLNYK